MSLGNCGGQSDDFQLMEIILLLVRAVLSSQLAKLCCSNMPQSLHTEELCMKCLLDLAQIEAAK